MSTNEVVKSDSGGGWPVEVDGGHAVTELLADVTGPLSPFGDVHFPVPADRLPYIHPHTIINR